MDLINIYFVFIFLTLGILFTVGALIWRGMWWISVLAGLVWILLGLGSMTYSQVFYYQRTLAIVFIIVGIGMLFMPAFYKRKEQKSAAEVLEEDDTAQYIRERNEFDESIRPYRRLGMRKKRV